jgi:transposase
MAAPKKVSMNCGLSPRCPAVNTSARGFCPCSQPGAASWSARRAGRIEAGHRWIVEACLSWLMNNRRLVRRYEREAEHFQAFADLGAILTS